MRSSIPPLAGYTVAVTADRRAEEQVALLRRRGADTIVGPTVRTVPLIDDDRLASAIEGLIAQPPDVVVLLTGIGTRGLIAVAEGMGRDAELVDVLRRSKVVARGAKAAGAATTVGLEVAWHAPGERASEILEHLRHDSLAGARVAVQRDGQGRAVLAAALADAGAAAIDIPVYRWELPEDTRPAQRLLDAVLGREVDAVTFTSRPAVDNLVRIAGASGREDGLLAALATDVLAVCVGPVCAERAAEVGITRSLVPNRARLGAMVQALVADGTERGSAVVATVAGDVTVQGRAVFVGDERAVLGRRERALFALLADARGAVVPKGRLLEAVWGESFADEHAVEVAVGRLRRGLGPVGRAVETVPRRGYRLAR